MIRGFFALGFLLFLAAAGVWAYRHYGNTDQATQQAEAKPASPTQPPVAPTPEVRPVEFAPPLPPPQPQRPVVAPVPPPAPQNGFPPTPRVGKKTHVVGAGETLWVISRRYFGSPAYVEQIADANHLDRPNRLRQGMVLVLPEIPGVPTQSDETAQSAPRRETPEVAPQQEEPMPPTLNHTVPIEAKE